MYKDYFGFIEPPFSIVPSARYLYLSARHREAMGHLQAGLGDGGGFAMLTGEVGTGKTTVSKAMLASLGEHIRAGLILNPTFSESDLLEAICDEFSVTYPPQATLKQLAQAIRHYLEQNHARGIQTLLLIDEAQHLSAQVLEQLRLLTNLETDTHKLLKVLLIGQPELQKKLQTPELRQLAQRITGRYHLLPLSSHEVGEYIRFRLQVSGCDKALFSSKAVRIIARQTRGIPRLINLIGDKALQYTCYAGETIVSAALAEKACQDVLAFQAPAAGLETAETKTPGYRYAVTVLLASALLGSGYYYYPQLSGLIGMDADKSVPVVEHRVEEEAVLQSDPMPEQFLRYSQNETEAMQTLYRLWGVQASVLEADCRLAENFPYFCEYQTGSADALRKLNRPVVLTMKNGSAVAYPVLYALGNTQAELMNNSQRIRLPLSWLEKHWQGEYRLVWFSDIRPTLKAGDQGDAVATLDQQLAAVLGERPLLTREFSPDLQHRVEAFQRWQGLTVDGVAGLHTLQVLSLIADTQAPQLKAVAEESPDAASQVSVQDYPEIGVLTRLASVIVQAAPTETIPAVTETTPVVADTPTGRQTDEPPLELGELDLSGLSPELAQRVQSALDEDHAADEDIFPVQSVIRLEEEQAQWHGRLPAMNLQTHMYSSSEEGRWVKINGQELHEGEWLDDQVRLLSISPRNIVVEFSGQQIEIPALYEWNG